MDRSKNRNKKNQKSSKSIDQFNDTFNDRLSHNKEMGVFNPQMYHQMMIDKRKNKNKVVPPVNSKITRRSKKEDKEIGNNQWLFKLLAIILVLLIVVIVVYWIWSSPNGPTQVQLKDGEALALASSPEFSILPLANGNIASSGAPTLNI